MSKTYSNNGATTFEWNSGVFTFSTASFNKESTTLLIEICL
jgi:hypothetical protein